ncbi:hypothetical protein PPK15_gp82 [Bacillus phage 000TH010]|uniref:Uncharacterized protein n=1 Tax=Bacillus phage 000TH010 TaxID=2601652 RepID=A0A5P8PI23_9CAUD|nr:hypothetical protein PPK15_gp82 [Bacillus phage 000TH010]QFR56295.1 hypothetical protein 000TH010_82 [Bacillus phage 000TH010]
MKAYNWKDKFVGTKIYGYNNGYFGRLASHDAKIIIASGENWVVALEEFTDDEPLFASFNSAEEMEELIKEWMEEDKENE